MQRKAAIKTAFVLLEYPLIFMRPSRKIYYIFVFAFNNFILIYLHKISDLFFRSDPLFQYSVDKLFFSNNINSFSIECIY
jgi:hypothetical protein